MSIAMRFLQHIILTSVAYAFCITIAQAESGFKPKYHAGDIFQDCALCPEMVVIPAGSFVRVSYRSNDKERTVYQMTVPQFAAGKYEVTFDQWAACVADGYCQSNPIPEDAGWGRESRPVINVSFDDIRASRGFIAWLNSKAQDAVYSLPSDAQWEYLARSAGPEAYIFGYSTAPLGTYAWFRSNSDGMTHPVGLKQPNSFGLYDMHGNVWEWLDHDWDEVSADGSFRKYFLSFSYLYAVRGGSWKDISDRLRAPSRGWLTSETTGNHLGFRVVRSIVGSKY